MPTARAPELVERPSGMRPWLLCLRGICWREFLRFLMQRGRFFAALVRPLVWLFIFAAGFRAVLGLSITPPYVTYILYEVYIMPGLVAMIQLFNGLQSSLSMVYDREVGAMRILLVSPFPRWFLLLSKLAAGIAVSLIRVYAFLVIAHFWGVRPPAWGYVTVLPALLLSGLMLGALVLIALGSLVTAGAPGIVVAGIGFVLVGVAIAPLTEDDVELVPLPRADDVKASLDLMSDALVAGEVDVISIWEPEPEDAIRQLGDDAIAFQDADVYREVFNLHATATALAEPAQRRSIVAFVRAVAYQQSAAEPVATCVAAFMLGTPNAPREPGAGEAS